ncbi:hypothetical protein D1AOALGA4SA_9901 [Olavius algarvensis Delta 1 endosymbiont]|nr:hypothetical protein D1AOALGA4SA_9901 [Olavius algarvensis Delta 1 endosymbiont]
MKFHTSTASGQKNGQSNQRKEILLMHRVIIEWTHKRKNSHYISMIR